MNKETARDLLQQFDFKALFLDELGWDDYNALLTLEVGDETVALEAIAEKRGMGVFLCTMPGRGCSCDYQTRCRIEAELAKNVREHIIIYVDSYYTFQIWQWFKREAGKPIARREHTFTAGQSGEALLQKIQNLKVSIEEEEQLTLFGVTDRASRAFDVDRVTRRFYDRFKTEHAAFLKQIRGIKDADDREWYTSLMLNRLMFVYFIQKKGFLDDDRDYLQNRLAAVRKSQGKDRFQSFYRYFLLRLFHDGLGKAAGDRKLDADLEKLLGRVPYLNGGFFEEHQLEKNNPELDIPDEAFEKVFAFFDQYHWHLEDRPLRDDNEINPDVLGYIFEKYINQKQMGAYYTKEDITDYISKNCIIPYILDQVEAGLKKKPGAFPALFQHLAADPDRYIYDPVKHGVGLPLPPEIARGVDTKKPDLLERRAAWNEPAPSEYALPTEIWREVVARRQRYWEVWSRLSGREAKPEWVATPPSSFILHPSSFPHPSSLTTNDLVTLNLDIRQFAQDCIENAVTPDVLRAFWQAIEQITVLDPTCGSGAFLFAAVNILEPLYEACLDRMRAFMLEWSQAPKIPHPNYYKEFDAVVAHVARHANEKYFVFKSIIINNLYGVDIMDEAVEICKLRLFLKLTAQLEADYTRENLGIEPLPDIDFNIRAGNTLVGFATEKQAEDVIRQDLLGYKTVWPEVQREATEIAEMFALFRLQQTELNSVVSAADKARLRKRLSPLESRLNEYMGDTYGFTSKRGITNWVQSHKPFHWFIEFYEIMTTGGFDVIIGNPPYVELSAIADQYSVKELRLLNTGNLYALCIERFSQLIRTAGRCGVIVPISFVSTPRMYPLMQLAAATFSPMHLSHFAVRPGKLFIGVDMNLTILLGRTCLSEHDGGIWSTTYRRWQEDSRDTLFQTLAYTTTALCHDLQCIPKLGDSAEAALFKLIRSNKPLAKIVIVATGDELYYHSGGRYYRKCLRQRLSNEYKRLVVPNGMGDATLCLMTSSLYYWFWIVISDCYHVTKRDVHGLPVSISMLNDPVFESLACVLLRDLEANATRRVRSRASGEEQVEVNFHVGRSKTILDKIDIALSTHYGMNPEQTDFVINVDAKYRVRNDDE